MAAGPGISNEFTLSLLQSEEFIKGLSSKLGKADTIDQSLGLLWYDLRPVVQLLYPYKELIPRISRLPRVMGDGGNAYNWKRITAVNVNNVSVGVSEGNRGGAIAINLEPQSATYKTIGLESNVSFEARLGAMNLVPDALGNAVQSTLRSVMIGEEQTLILGDAALALGTTPTPSLSTPSGTGSSFTGGSVYITAVALTGFGWKNSLVNAAGVPGKIVRINTDGSQDTFGGGSAAPSAEATSSISSGNSITATVAWVNGAVAYAWYVGQTAGAETLAAITTTNQATFTKSGAAGNQSIVALGGPGAGSDNSTNALLPDGILTQVFGSVFGSAPSLAMSTNPNLPSVSTGTLAISAGGSLVLTMNAGNSGLTVAGTNIAEWDVILQAAYDQYKIGFDRILLSAQDVANWMGQMLGQNAAAAFRIFFDADAETGRIVAGRRVTSYLNKFMGNTLDVEIHPFLPPGTQLFWSDRIPYELSGVPNILEVHSRMDYYQIQWPFRSRRYEYGVYCDEVFSCYFTPAFAVLNNCNSSNGTPKF